MKKLLRSIYAKKLIFWPLLIVVVFVGFKIASSGNKVVEETVAVSKGDVVETVTATGTVRPKNSAILRFETAGTISTMNVDVGDKVVKGQILASLNAGDLRQRVVQAEAELAAAQVSLLNAGQSSADAGAKNDQTLATAYADALAGLGNVLNLVQNTKNTVSKIYNEASLSNKARPLEKLDVSYETIVVALQKLVPTSSRAEIEAALTAVYPPLLVIQDVALDLVRQLNELTTNETNNGYRDDAADALTDSNTAIAQVAAYGKAITDAQTDSGLNTNTSSASYRNAQAAVGTAQAAVSVARAGLANAYLTAPISGIIASKSKNIGESVVPADQVYYLLGEGGLEITANIPEVDIAKIVVGNKADVTLDAYGDEMAFDVFVALIDPAETVIDGVATYKVTFRFAAEDPRIRSGMTANIVVSTQKREGVVVAPQRAIHIVDGKRMVTVLSGDARTEHEVKTGLRGNDGNVEILSGVVPGDVLVIAQK